ncbi:MAG: fluoride efflux transporter CrcB [Pseudomonadota bacterium]
MALIPYMQLGLVMLGGALGSLARYLCVLLVGRMPVGAFPLGTMLVNILGSFAIGLLMARFMLQDTPGARVFLVTGVLGGFTTFSAFSWDALQLMQRGQIGLAGAYVLGSVLLSFAAVAGGYQIGR